MANSILALLSKKKKNLSYAPGRDAILRQPSLYKYRAMIASSKTHLRMAGKVPNPARCGIVFD